MKYLILTSIILFLISCQSQDKKVSYQPTNMRHGLAIFTGPEKTVDKTSDNKSIKRGERLYSQYCLKCHGSSGKGDGFAAEGFEIKPSNLAVSAKHLEKYYLIIQINQGRSGMPNWKELLSPTDLNDLTEYIKTF